MGCGERKRELPGSREGQPAGSPGDDDGLSASYCKPAMVAGIHFWQWLFTRLFTGNFYLLQPAFPFGKEQEPAAKFRRAHDFQHRSSAAAPDGCCRVIETYIETGLRLAVLMPGQYTKSIAGPYTSCPTWPAFSQPSYNLLRRSRPAHQVHPFLVSKRACQQEAGLENDWRPSC